MPTPMRRWHVYEHQQNPEDCGGHGALLKEEVVKMDITIGKHQRLEPEPTPRIHRVEIVHRYQSRRHTAPPPWIVPLVFIVALMFISPYALIVSFVLISVVCGHLICRYVDRRR
jgi:hypothetical protein